VHNKASSLSKNGDVLARYKELQEDTRALHGITVDSLLSELDKIKAIAMEAETPQCSAATSCVMNKAKLVGLDIVKIDHTVTAHVYSIDTTASPEEAARAYIEMMEAK
jgi:hypothetical protein